MCLRDICILLNKDWITSIGKFPSWCCIHYFIPYGFNDWITFESSLTVCTITQNAAVFNSNRLNTLIIERMQRISFIWCVLINNLISTNRKPVLVKIVLIMIIVYIRIINQKPYSYPLFFRNGSIDLNSYTYTKQPRKG